MRSGWSTGSRAAALEADQRGRRGQGIGAERQSADRHGIRSDLLDHLVEQLPDQAGALGIEADLLAVDVEVGGAPRRQHHLALLEGVSAEQLEQAIALGGQLGPFDQWLHSGKRYHAQTVD